MGLTRKGIVDQKPQFIPTLSLIIQNNSKVMFNTHVILFQYMTKAFCFNQNKMKNNDNFLEIK